MTPNYNGNCILPMAKGDFFIHCLGQLSIWIDVTTIICYCLYDKNMPNEIVLPIHVWVVMMEPCTWLFVVHSGGKRSSIMIVVYI